MLARSALLLTVFFSTASLAEADICAAPTPPDAAAAEAAYTLALPLAPIKLKKGESGTARVAVVPKPDAHVDPAAPSTVTLTAGPGLELPKAKLSKTDAKFDSQGIQFDLPFVAKAAGPDTLKASLVFFICTANLCERQKKDVTVAVVVE